MRNKLCHLILLINRDNYFKAIGVGAFVIMIFTCCIFLLYDFLVKREALENWILLESKRIYVRFISHEIRTPLNVVCLCMQVLQSDLSKLISLIRSSSTLSDEDKEAATDLLQDSNNLVTEISESSSAAVTVLNDLINYDKIESKTLMLDRKLINPLNILVTVIRPMQVQARQNEVTLDMNFMHLDGSSAVIHKEYEYLSNYYTIGDSVKLSQVYRNVISNALKFSPPNGKVSIEGEYCCDK